MRICAEKLLTAAIAALAISVLSPVAAADDIQVAREAFLQCQKMHKAGKSCAAVAACEEGMAARESPSIAALLKEAKSACKVQKEKERKDKERERKERKEREREKKKASKKNADKKNADKKNSDKKKSGEATEPDGKIGDGQGSDTGATTPQTGDGSSAQVGSPALPDNPNGDRPEPPADAKAGDDTAPPADPSVEPLPSTGTPALAESEGPNVWGWVAGGAGLALVGTGVALAVVAVDSNSDAQSELDNGGPDGDGVLTSSELAAVEEKNQEAQTLSIAGWSLVGVGAASLIAGVVVLAVTWPDGSEDGGSADAVSLSPNLAVSPDGSASMGLTFRF